VDFETILNIPIGDTPVDDRIVWHFDSKGQYSVKSDYHVGMSSWIEAEFSCQNNLSSW
ncbi:hypothetical protein PanWU01x14_057990, partial [Parasponia andersonii]